MSISFLILFILFAGFIAYGWISTYLKNEASPVVATRARLIDKRADCHTVTDANGAMSTSETLLLYYELDTGSQMRFTVRGRVYRAARTGEWGTLTFQGTRFLRFESMSGVLE